MPLRQSPGWGSSSPSVWELSLLPRRCLSLVLFYLIAGFLFSYLWTRLYLPGAFVQQDIAQKLLSLKKKIEQADIRSKDAQAASVGTGKTEPPEVMKKLLAATEGVAP